MKNLLFVSALVIFLLSGCKKEENESDNNSIPSNPCASCEDLNSVAVTPTSTHVFWDGFGRDYYQVEYGINGYTLGQGNTENSNIDYLTLTGLSSNTAYDFYVRANCGGNSWSDWAGPYSFLTD